MDIINVVFDNVFSFTFLIAILLAVSGGIIVGALPGFSATMAIAILIPFTYAMDSATAVMILMAIYTSAVYGGSISAILLHTPGTPSSAATAEDGYALTLQGKADLAIRISTLSSMCGGLFGTFVLLTLAPPLSLVSLKFGPPEYFLLAVFGLTIIASVSSRSLVKGLLSGVFGLLFGAIGVDMRIGFPRFVFGIHQLEGGISFIAVLIGLFSLSQVLIMSETACDESQDNKSLINVTKRKIFPTVEEIRQVWLTILRCAPIGCFIGMLPGAGGDIGSWVGYNEAKRFSKRPEEFGKGSIEGVAGSETANNAVTAGAMIPTLTLGIPGSGVAAVILGGLMLHGLIPGRELFTTYATITYSAIIGLFLANIVMGIIGFLGAPYSLFVANVPKRIMSPIIFILCVIGTYTIGHNVFEIWTMLFFGLLGYFMRKNDFHPAPMILGIILGPMAEHRIYQSLTLARGNPLLYFLRRPICIILIILILVSLVTPYFLKNMKKRNED